MPKIDVARLNALKPKPKPSENPPETVRIPSDDGEYSMEVDRVPMGRTLRKRKEKVEKHLKRGANDKEKESFPKRVFRIPIDKPFEEAYYTHRLWMFFRETREKEEDIKRMFCEAREKMRKRVTLKKKSDPGKFTIPCTVKGIEFPHALCDTGTSINILPGVMADHLGLQIGNALVPVDFHVLDIKLNWNYSLLLVRAFLSTTSSRRINDPGIIAACHCGVEYETEYSTSIKTHIATSIDSGHQKSTDTQQEESVDSSPDDWENDYYNPTIAAYTRQNMHTEEYDENYEDGRATEYKAILDEEDTLLHHSSWKRNTPSIDITCSPSIDTQPHQRNQKRASTDIADYSSIDTKVNCVREGDYSIGSRADDHHHKSYAVEIEIYGEDELHEGFTYEEFLNMQRRDETDQHQGEAAWGRTRPSHPIDRASRPSIDINPSTSIDVAHTISIDIRCKPKTAVSEKDKFDNKYLTPGEFGIFRDPDGYARAIDGRILHVSRKDIADILQTANGAENLFVHQRNILEYQQKDTKEFYDTAGGIDKSFKQRSRHPTRPSIDVDVPTSVDRRPEFGRRAFDFYGTRNFYWEEKNEYGVYRDDQGYARDLEGRTIHVHNRDIRRLMERASRDEPSYICLPEHARSFTQTKLVPEIYTKDEINEMFYGVCGAQEKYEGDFKMKLDGVNYPLNDSIGHHASIDSRLPTSIDQRLPASVDNNPPHSPPMKSQQGELVDIQSYIACRPEASASIDRHNNISTDIRRQTLVDDATNRSRLVP
ncbi:hypothetical protein DY000_02022495 [Brassica cretica]|uniref:Aspartic peptidase DDI1-type domain-containing protein n=1 Tax=Brassica cretica TaxID=69181 RepID=A0ABQ7ELM5_BRACR|nr:hypothetical protein DY000_02022495 [Brassica cretica]